MLAKEGEQLIVLPAEYIVEALIDSGFHVTLALADGYEVCKDLLRPVGHTELNIVSITCMYRRDWSQEVSIYLFKYPLFVQSIQSSCLILERRFKIRCVAVKHMKLLAMHLQSLVALFHRPVDLLWVKAAFAISAQDQNLGIEIKAPSCSANLA